jgi:gliding motility-associated-like protein
MAYLFNIILSIQFMRYSLYLICFIFILLIHSNSSGQTKKLPLDHKRFSISNGLFEDDQENILYCNTILPASIFGEIIKTSNITSLSKGNKVNFSFDYEFQQQTIPSALKKYKDGFLQASYTNSTTRNKHLMRLSSKGDVLWSNVYGASNDSDPTNNGVSDIEVETNDNILLAGGAASFTSSTKQNDIYLGQISSDGKQSWGKNYCFSCDNAQSIFSSITKVKGGTIVVGTISTSTFDEDVLVYKVDDLGKVIWAKKYSKANSSFLSKFKGVEVVEKKNGNLIVIANDEELDENNGSYMLELSESGNLISALEINLNESRKFTLSTNNAFLDKNENVILSAGAVQDSIPTVSKELNILLSLSTNGNLKWKYNYYDEILVGFGTSISKAFPLKSGLIANMTNNAENFDKLFPILVVTDDNGINNCELPVNITTKKSNLIIEENLTIKTLDVNGEENYPVNKKVYIPSIGNIELKEFADTIICDEAITIGSALENVESYAWSTGENTPTIQVEKAGLYTVILKNSKICFLQKDTIIVKKDLACDTITIDPNNPADTLIMPNVFLPNSGNGNSLFSVVNTNFSPTALAIYDVWGELVFNGDSSNNFTWDGTFNGQEAEQGVYVYVLTYNYKNNTKRRVGDITLLR